MRGRFWAKIDFGAKLELVNINEVGVGFGSIFVIKAIEKSIKFYNY